jgi:hypothetical protein
MDVYSPAARTAAARVGLVWAAYLQDEHAVVERISLVCLAEAARDLRAQTSKQGVRGGVGEKS